MSDTRARSAIFSSPDAVYHADRCEPLRAATRAGEVRLEALARRGYPGRPMPREKPATSVTDTAYACGFSSSQYFATVFRRQFGCRPGDYRARGGG
ncbi:MAG: helix-turn-helix domain-containing protein [Verrucomicrobia bacterium]|nr:helix-turn-helix domain-containing protein [Verrucomicrobiota bacterium]